MEFSSIKGRVKTSSRRMELSFTRWRVAILVVLLIGFWASGGFSMDAPAPSSGMRAWILSMAAFVLGAVSATVVDHWIGNLDRANLRWAYVVLGTAAMAAGVIVQHVVEARFALPS